jgi:hypothetical protein
VIPPGLSPSNSRSSSSSDNSVVTPEKPFNWAEDVEAASAIGVSSYGGAADDAYPPLDLGEHDEDEDDALDLPSVSAVEIPQMQENLWAGYDEPKEVEEIEPVCPTHGVLCSRGVCKDYTKMLKDIERKKPQEKGKRDQQRGWNKGKPGTSRAPREQVTEKQYWAKPERGRPAKEGAPIHSLASLEHRLTSLF